MKNLFVVMALAATLFTGGCASFAQENQNVNKSQMLFLYQHCWVSPDIANQANPTEYCKKFSGLSEDGAMQYCMDTTGETRSECESTIRAAKRRVADAKRRKEQDVKAVRYCQAKLGKSEQYCLGKVSEIRDRLK